MKTQTWSSTPKFLLAAVGASVGLANVWKFPTSVGTNGGGAFILVYFIAVTLIVVPILIGELMIGRKTGKSPVMACIEIARENGLSRHWKWVGYMGVFACFAVLTYYSVIAGWTLDYAVQAMTGQLSGFDAVAANSAYTEMLASPMRMILSHTMFIAFTVLVILGGLHGGIERLSSYAMPAFFLLLAALVVFAAFQGGFSKAAAFMFIPDFSKVTGLVVLNALGQAFFSIGVGFCFMMMYGAFMEKDTHIPTTAFVIAYADMFVAVLAGLAIFPMVFAYGFEASEGPGLIFVTLAAVFGNMTGGAFVGGMFFLLMMFAGLTSAVALLEPVVHHFEEKYEWNRRTITLLAGGVAWCVGVFMALSYNVLADFHPLGFIEVLSNKNLFDLIDFIVSNIILPLGALLICLLAGWALSRDVVQKELRFRASLSETVWRLSIRYLSPIALVVILITGIT